MKPVVVEKMWLKRPLNSPVRREVGALTVCFEVCVEPRDAVKVAVYIGPG
jgi:hypothetical protein